MIRRRRGRTTIGVQRVRTAPDLVERDFNPTVPDRLGYATYHVYPDVGGVAVPGVGDGLLQPPIVGWALADHMRAELVVEAFEMAVQRRRPEGRPVHHSDQGSPVRVAGLHAALSSVDVDVSIGSKGNCSITARWKASTRA